MEDALKFTLWFDLTRGRNGLHFGAMKGRRFSGAFRLIWPKAVLCEHRKISRRKRASAALKK
jgi:hypothetical protein